ncbi:MAG: phosphomannomutase/phosphoglucomutase [Campylobacteraceae bacterium]|nr:phosphomannomutase/phosphoglucomutase [Campylobacteraceae bacterium]
MTHIFREYDIRGIYKKDLTEDVVKNIGALLGKRISKVGKRVAVGYDARTHSPLITEWLMSGLNYAGLSVENMGLVPTPCNYFAGFKDDKADATVMITGSHNPPEYNGFKMTINQNPFFGEDITSLGKEVLKALKEKKQIPTNLAHIDVSTLKDYVAFLSSHFAHLKDMKTPLVIDCGNGAAGEAVRAVCDTLSLNAKILYETPDGTFPNHHPDPSEIENLRDIQNILEQDGAKLGFAFDGDADRLAVLTKENNFKGDQLVLMYAKTLKNPRILGEVKCSQVMYDEVAKIGKAYMYKTGHSNIKVKMKELNIDIAAEVSGHIFFADRYFGYDDAIYAMLRTLELVKDGMDLDLELEKLPHTYSTEELKIPTTEEEKFKTIEKLRSFLENPPSDFPPIRDIITVDGVRVVFEKGWGLIRASNTTPVLVARFEATEEKEKRRYQDAMEKALKACQC